MALPLSSLPAGLWRASELAYCHRAGHTTGFAALDAELPGGGWPHGVVTELLSERPGIGEWRLLAPALRDLTQAGKPVMVIAPPMLPYAPALAGWGHRFALAQRGDAPGGCRVAGISRVRRAA